MLRRLVVLALPMLAACGVEEPQAVVDTGFVVSGPEATAPLDSPYEAAAATHGVPASLLQAIALTETGMQMVIGEEEHEGRPRAYGVMALRDDVVDRAASLAQVTRDAARFDIRANVAAAAALLSAWADEAAIDRTDLGAWAPLVARYSGITHEEAASDYVHHGVYRRLREGAVFEGGLLGKVDVQAAFPAVERSQLVGQSGAIWTPSPNYNSRGGAAVDFVIIHSCEGSYSGCWSWLTNTAAGASAHYVVNDAGTEVRQLVDEANRAWHIAANYDCGYNGNVECYRNGTSMNSVSVGIEHAGYASQTSWSSGLLQRSAELTCGISQRHGVPRDSYHIVAHGRLQPWNRTDPGPNWPWSDYLNRVDVACGGGGTNPGTGNDLVIDSNNGANDTSRYYLEVSTNWVSSTNVSGYWNTGYYAGPGETGFSDPARFKFNLAASTCYEVQAWWTSASDRATSAPFIWYDAAGAERGRANVNQTVNGGRWNSLGYGIFSAGWNQVVLSRWVSPGTYVIADAVKLVESTACPGWGTPVDSDGDGTPDASDGCPNDAAKTSPGTCGCGVADTDSDGDGTPNCIDSCPTDPGKTSPGTCGCGTPDVDSDGDGTLDCLDGCPTDPLKTSPGTCGCGVVDEDLDGDGLADCVTCGDGQVSAPETCDDGNRVAGDGCSATCQTEPLVMAALDPGTAGVPNLFRAYGARASAGVYFVASANLGVTPVPGCPGVTVPLAQPRIAGLAMADANGVASRTMIVPAGLAGRTMALVAVEMNTCRVSNLVLERF